MPDLIYPRHGPDGQTPELFAVIQDRLAVGEVDGERKEFVIKKAEVAFKLDRAKAKQIVLFLLPYVIDI